MVIGMEGDLMRREEETEEFIVSSMAGTLLMTAATQILC